MIKNRITSENIVKLQDDEIFVFGSNEGGRHGAGAAKLALKWGAIYGQANGLQGKTYAIPTMNKSISKPLDLLKIKVYVDQFIDFAQENTRYQFLVTEIGCGLAGLKIKDIAPLFKRAQFVENISLPQRFWRKL